MENVRVSKKRKMRPRQGSFFLKSRLSEFAYVELTLGAFVFAPEVRRIIDWRSHFSLFNVISIVPLIMLIPIGVMAFRRRRLLSVKGFYPLACIWIAAFAYSVIIGLVHKTILPELYGVALFVFPVVVAPWLLTRPESLEYSYRRISRILLIYGGLAGAYGIIQYALAPPWDTAWIQSVAATAFGLPERFQIRVFSVLNSPATYAEFTTFVFTMNLPNLRFRNPFVMLATLLMIAGVLLSLVRAAWLGILVGALTYVIVSPRRMPVVRTMTICALFVAASGLAFFVFVPSDSIRETIAQRFATFGSLDTDYSALDRQNEARNSIDSGLADPLGHGLGMTGVSAELATRDEIDRAGVPDDSIDNGFLSRFVEMGAPGLAIFAFAILLALIQTFRAMRHHLESHDIRGGTIVAAMFTTQVAIAAITISGDTYLGIGSVVFWLAVALSLKQSQESRFSTKVGTVSLSRRWPVAAK